MEVALEHSYARDEGLCAPLMITLCLGLEHSDFS